jgi:hypothetical protein
MNPASGRSPYISFDLIDCEVCKGTGEVAEPALEPEPKAPEESKEGKPLQKPARATLRKSSE